MPLECGVWSCRWLVNDDMTDQSRPNRSHIVVDILPDFVTIRHNETGDEQHIQVLQCWIDPQFPAAHRTAQFRAYLARRGEDNIAALIRFDSQEVLTILPPSMSEDGQWHEVTSGRMERQYNLAKVVDGLRHAWDGQATKPAVHNRANLMGERVGRPPSWKTWAVRIAITLAV